MCEEAIRRGNKVTRRCAKTLPSAGSFFYRCSRPHSHQAAAANRIQSSGSFSKSTKPEFRSRWRLVWSAAGPTASRAVSVESVAWMDQALFEGRKTSASQPATSESWGCHCRPMKEVSLLEMIGRSMAKVAAGAGIAALLIWLTYVMLDVGHMQSGFTLPQSRY